MPPIYPLAGPESEELAALYDRFLLRRRVTPVSDDGVLELLLGVAGRAESGERGELPISTRRRASSAHVSAFSSVSKRSPQPRRLERIDLELEPERAAAVGSPVGSPVPERREDGRSGQRSRPRTLLRRSTAERPLKELRRLPRAGMAGTAASGPVGATYEAARGKGPFEPGGAVSGARLGLEA